MIGGSQGVEFHYALLASGHLPAPAGCEGLLLMLSQIFHTNFESNLFVLDREADGQTDGQTEGRDEWDGFLSFSIPKCLSFSFSLFSSLNDGVERSPF